MVDPEPVLTNPGILFSRFQDNIYYFHEYGPNIAPPTSDGSKAFPEVPL